MAGTTTTIILLLFALLAIWIVVRQLRAYGRIMAPARRGLPYEPVVDPNPPDLVARTPGVVAVSVGSFVWAGSHFVAAMVWVATGYVVERTVKSVVVAVYLCAAAFVTAIGAMMLLRCERYGRRALGMGQFLFALAAFFGIAVAVLLPRGQEIPSQWFTVAFYIAVGMALHLLIDTMLGAAAQHVGKVAGGSGKGGPAGG